MKLEPLTDLSLEALFIRFGLANQLEVGDFLFSVNVDRPLYDAMCQLNDAADRRDWNDDTIAACMQGLLFMYSGGKRAWHPIEAWAHMKGRG